MDRPYLPAASERSFKTTLLPVLMAAGLHAGLLAAFWIGQPAGASLTHTEKALEQQAAQAASSSDTPPPLAAAPVQTPTQPTGETGRPPAAAMAPMTPLASVTTLAAAAPVASKVKIEAGANAHAAAPKRSTPIRHVKPAPALASARTATGKAAGTEGRDRRHAVEPAAKLAAAGKRSHAVKPPARAELARSHDARRMSAGSEHGIHKGQRS